MRTVKKIVLILSVALSCVGCDQATKEIATITSKGVISSGAVSWDRGDMFPEKDKQWFGGLMSQTDDVPGRRMLWGHRKPGKQHCGKDDQLEEYAASVLQ